MVFSFVLEGEWGELSKGEQLQMQVFSEEVRDLDPHPPTPSPTLPKATKLENSEAAAAAHAPASPLASSQGMAG